MNRIVPAIAWTILFTGDYLVHRRLSCSQASILFTTTILHVQTIYMHSVHGDYPVHRRLIILFTGDCPVHVNRIVSGEQDSPYYSGDYPVHRGLSCSQATILFRGDYPVSATILHVHTSHMHSVHGDYPVHRRLHVFCSQQSFELHQQ